MKGPYDDIINRPHHVSDTRPQMSSINRAAQFSAFSALTGYNSAIKETGRLTTERPEPGESEIALLDMKLRILEDSVADHPEITVTYYKPDEKKAGGAYITTTSELKRIDAVKHTIMLTNGDQISIPDVLDIACERFAELA